MPKRRMIVAAVMLLLLAACALPEKGQQASESSINPETETVSALKDCAVERDIVSSEPERDSASTVESEPEKSAIVEPDLDWMLADHIYSHRGASGYEIEHTFASYDLALEQGSHNIEQDLVTSRDGTLFVSHDENAERIAGKDRDYADMTDKEIAQLRTANGEGIHSMEEVFQRYGRDVTYVVELKEGLQQARAFAELVKEYNMEKNVVVQSFFPDALEEMEELYPDLPKLYLCRDEDGFSKALRSDYADIVCVSGKLLSEEAVKQVHETGKQFCVYWTGEEEVRRAIELGADSYFTNYTDQALELERIYRNK